MNALMIFKKESRRLAMFMGLYYIYHNTIGSNGSFGEAVMVYAVCKAVDIIIDLYWGKETSLDKEEKLVSPKTPTT